MGSDAVLGGRVSGRSRPGERHHWYGSGAGRNDGKVFFDSVNFGLSLKWINLFATLKVDCEIIEPYRSVRCR